MSALRGLAAAGAVVVALVVQVSVFPHLSWDGIVPNVCLLVVVAAGLVRGAEFAAVLGFCAGLALDLAPPADHLAGRWALALVVVGYVAGRVRQGQRPTAATAVATVAASSFVGTSVFALTGLILSDPSSSVPELLEVIALGVVWDVVLCPLVLPPVMGMFRRIEPDRSLA